MKQRRIRWTVRALWRLDEIGAHIENDDRDAAPLVVARLVESVDMLAELPAAGRIGRIAGTREVVPSDCGEEAVSNDRIRSIIESTGVPTKEGKIDRALSGCESASNFDPGCFPP